VFYKGQFLSVSLPQGGKCDDRIVPAHALEASDGAEVQLHSVLTSALGGGE
jgi:hypothetical protein